MASFPRAILPFEVSSLEMPGPLISKAQSGRVNLRTTQQIGRTWTEHYMVNVRSVDGRALLAAVDNLYRNGTIFSIDHRDHLTPLGVGGGSPVVNQATQLITDPENFGAWTVSGTPILTAGQTDPYGSSAAYLINDDSAAAFEFISHAVNFTGNAEKCCSLFIRQGSNALQWARIQDSTAGLERHRIIVTWTAGVPALTTGAGSGTRYAPIDFGGGWWWIAFTGVGVIAANANKMEFGPGSSVSSADTGTGYFFGANAWDSLTPAGYIGPSHTTATGNRLFLDGATASVSNWLRAGDVLSIGGVTPIYEVTADVASEANGYVSVPVNPPIFAGGAPSDNAIVTITGVTLQSIILEPPSVPSTSGNSSDYGELTLKFSEAL